MAYITGWIFLTISISLTLQTSFALFDIKCLDRRDDVPALPDAYSTNIRINYPLEEYSMEVKYATIGKENKEYIEFKTKNKHFAYITTGENKTALIIEYRKDAHPSCKVEKEESILDIDKELAGKNKIFSKAVEVMMFPNEFDLYQVSSRSDLGIVTKRFDGCITDPKVNISMMFAVDSWSHPMATSLSDKVNYPVMAIAELDDAIMMALYSNFDPTTPDSTFFQPPEDVYCEGYREDKKPPKMNDYFSYNSEVIIYESALGIAPIVSYRQVYYDYPSRISRIDSHDALAEDPDLFSDVFAQTKSIIHDYNAGSQYILKPNTGNCTVDSFEATFSVLSVDETKDNKMLTGDEYFWLDNARTSYNGQYRVNGKMADVYTATRVNPQSNKKEVISWAFASEETRVVGNEKMEKNVLLRMYVRPETDLDYEGVKQINFYNFVNEEPSAFSYDVTSCFNESTSLTLVITFPGHNSLRGSDKLIGRLTHMALKNTMGIRKQRINMKQVLQVDKYIYAEFTIVGVPPAKESKASKEISIEEALDKLRKSISAGNFSVNVPISDKSNQVINLRPEPDGLNVFAGDRRPPPADGYKQSSVIGLTIGMLFLGIVLGGVTLNLIMNKKFGVSLFQKSRSGDEMFNNPLNESPL